VLEGAKMSHPEDLRFDYTRIVETVNTKDHERLNVAVKHELN